MIRHPLDLTPLRALIDRVVARWRPEQIWVFGSRARGDAHASSDWDLLVVVPDDIDDAELDPLVGWRLQKDSGVRVRADVFPCRSSDFQEDRDTPNTLAHDAAVDGVLIYLDPTTVPSIENAPLDPDALSAEEAAELDARLARPLGVTYTTAEILERTGDRAKHEE